MLQLILLYVTIFGKIDHLRASNEIHFLPVQERYIHALSRNTNCLTIDGQVCFYRPAAFYRCCETTTRVHFMVLGCVNRTAWGTKLLLTAVLASLVDCISSGHLLKVQHCSLSPNWSFTEGTALLFESELVLCPAFGSPPAPTTHPTPLPPAHPL